MRKTGLIMLFCTVLGMAGCSGVRPVLGLKEGKLTPCPETPNCVSSQSTDPAHMIDPLPLHDPVPEAFLQLKNIVLALPRTRIIAEQDGYLRVEFTSLVFRFVDDVEFAADVPDGVIHVRSASRIGHSDLGVNRKRIEEIRAHWNARGR